MKKLLQRVALLAGLTFAASLPMLGQVTSVSVSVEPTGAPYQVDGTMYYAPSLFTWPRGSKHSLEIMAACVYSPVQPVPDVCQARYKPGTWTTKNGSLDAPISIITADPEITSYKGSSVVEYRIRLSFFDVGGSTATHPVDFPANKCLGSKPSNGAPGVACVGGQCYNESTDLWVASGELTLYAVPYNGFVFTGWYTGGSPTAFVGNYKVIGSGVVLNPRFEPAKRVQLITDPPNLHVLVDRAEVITSDPQYYVPTCSAPGFFDFAEGSSHVLGAPSPQVDLYNKEWVFDSWSNGGGQNMVYKAEKANISEKLVAKFIPGTRVSLRAPAGLKLIIDGSDSWPSYNFIWGAGTKHIITAPAEQIDQTGRKYVFKGWSNGSAATTQEITLDSKDFTGVYIAAEYSMLGMIRLQSDYPVTMQVGDQTCETPCTIHREVGTELRITAPKTVTIAEGSRVELQSLSGDTTGIKVAKLGTETVVYLANYRIMHRILTSSDPVSGAEFRMEPDSSDAYYAVNTRVKVYSIPRAGYRLKRWEGDSADRLSPATVIVSGPVSLRAILEAVPEISKAGVKNGAGETPVPGVAAGSIVSVYGGSLAPNSEIDSSNPLKQTLAGVIVRVSGHILPLFFVSPQQINAQLPYDLSLGTNTLTVENRYMPEVSTTFEVMRNAPGLISNALGDLSLAAASRVEGPTVSSDDPVKPGELISIFGTGFGPFRISPPEGFAVKESDGYRLIDEVQVAIGDQIITPEFTGPATGLPGVVALRFRTPANLSDKSITRLKVLVNGVSSNEVVLPTAVAYMPAAEPIAQ